MYKSISRYDYYIRALAYGCYEYKAWIIRCFSIVSLGGPETDKWRLGQPVDETGKVYPFFLFEIDGNYAFKDPETKEITLLIDSPVTEPLLYVKEAIPLKPGDAVNVKEDMESTCGRLLYNYLAIIYPFGSTIDYVNKQTSLPALEKEIVSRLKENEDVRNEDNIYVDQLDDYYRGTGMLGGLNTISVPSATERTLTPAPGYEKVLDALLEKHKDQLTDPVILAAIWKEIEAIDRKYIAEDPDGGFYQSDKYFNVVRKKMLYMYGEESKFDGSGIEFIPTPLRDGIDITKLPTMINSLRDGSHNRGAMTALGGEAAKDIFRAATGSKIVTDNCGTIEGLSLVVTERNSSSFVGNSIVQDKKSILLTKANIGSYIDKTVSLRTPAYCEADGGTCISCTGEFIRGKETSITLLLSEAGSEMMSRFMAKMHGTALQTVKLLHDSAWN